METFKEEDVEAFQETVKNYDEISRLDQWLTTMLLRVKRKIEKGDDDLKWGGWLLYNYNLINLCCDEQIWTVKSSSLLLIRDKISFCLKKNIM